MDQKIAAIYHSGFATPSQERNLMHLVFYDGTCGFCDHMVRFLIKVDRKQQFLFASLQGKTAAEVLRDLPEGWKSEDSLVLIENFRTPLQKFYILGQGALRICWLLGGAWRILGVFSFLPGWLYNWAYRLIAKYRYRLFSHEVCLLPDSKHSERFLP